MAWRAGWTGKSIITICRTFWKDVLDCSATFKLSSRLCSRVLYKTRCLGESCVCWAGILWKADSWDFSRDLNGQSFSIHMLNCMDTGSWVFWKTLNWLHLCNTAALSAQWSFVMYCQVEKCCASGSVAGRTSVVIVVGEVGCCCSADAVKDGTWGNVNSYYKQIMMYQKGELLSYWYCS